jgi:4-carboxymuconolactone decarboxylase
VHARLAHEAGISDAVIEAIRTAEPPEFTSADEASVYRLTRELLHHGTASDETYADVRERFGTVGIVELTALVGYYTMVAMTLNAHEVPLPALESSIRPLQFKRTEGALPSPTPLAQARLVPAKQTASV